MLLIGYGISAASPFVLGVVHDATGGFGAVLWIMVAMAGAMLPLALALDPPRLRRTVVGLGNRVALRDRRSASP